MSWYQSMAGAEVHLSPSVQQRIGVAGFGVDDVGVIRNPRMLAAVFRIGQQVSAVEDKAIEEFLDLEHGSDKQINAANPLGRRCLRGLRSWIDRRVDERMERIPGTAGEAYAEYSKWAKESGWEIPVGCLDNYPYRCFSMADEGGLCVFECAVNKVPGAIGDVLITLVDELVINALKMPAIAAIQYSMMMGMDSSGLSRNDGFADMRNADGRAVLEWLEKVEPDMCDEMKYWAEDGEAQMAVACQLRDVAFADFDEQRRIQRAVGDAGKDRLRNREAYMARIKQAAANCEEGALRDFALMACDCLAGDSTGELIQRLPADERFERIPGDLSVVDTGFVVDDIDYYYNNINEIALNGDDIAVLPLESAPELVVEILARITLCERLIIALGSLLEEQEQLSRPKAA